MLPVSFEKKACSQAFSRVFHKKTSGNPEVSRSLLPLYLTPLPLRSGNFIRTQAAGAGAYAAGTPVYHCLNTLNIWFPNFIGSSVGVGYFLPKCNTFTAEFTFSHCLHLLLRNLILSNRCILSDKGEQCKYFLNL